MERPKYKELYLAEKKRADYWAGRHIELNKTLEKSHKDGLDAAKGRAEIRADYATLHQRAVTFLDHIKQDILSPSNEKNGWLYLAALDPENAQAFLRKFALFSTYVSEKTPKPLI